MYRGVGLIITACAFWAFDTLIRYPLIAQGVGALEIVFIEHVILTCLLLSWFFYKQYSFKMLILANWGSFILLGGLGSALATYAFTKSFEMLNPSLVIILQKLQPIFAIAMTRILLRESISKYFITWASMAMIGVFMISAPDLVDTYQILIKRKATQFDYQTLFGYLLVAISIVGWGLSTVLGKRLQLRGLKPDQIMTGRFSGGMIALVFLYPLMPFNSSDSILVFGKISLMVLISGLLAMLFFYHGLKYISARLCTILELFFPLFAVLVNWIFLDATLQVTQVIGACILVLSSTIVVIKKY